DAEIELIEHPGGRRALGGCITQELERFVDQVFVVEQAAALFFLLITFDDGGCDRYQRGTAVACPQRELLRNQAANAVLFGIETRSPLRMGVGQVLGDDTGTGLPDVGAEYIEVVLDPLPPGNAQGGSQ